VPGVFNPSIDGPLIGGTCLLAGMVAFSATTGGCGWGALAVFVKFGDRPGTGAPAGRRTSCRASSKVPHIPQKRKLSELSSPHFGQITNDSPQFFSYSLTRAGQCHCLRAFILECRFPDSVHAESF
jgi:hypothetical protein